MIFIVKTVRVTKDSDEEKWYGPFLADTDAFFILKDDAFRCVAFNYGDLSENGYNQYAVICSVKQGVYPIPHEEQWFQWNKEKNAYEMCDRPAFMHDYGLPL